MCYASIKDGSYELGFMHKLEKAWWVRKGHNSLGFFGARMLWPRRSHENGKDNAPYVSARVPFAVCPFPDAFHRLRCWKECFQSLTSSASSLVKIHDKSMHIAFHLD